MATKIGTRTDKGSNAHKSRRSKKRKVHLHRPNGGIGARVQKVGPDRFAIVCVDPAKQRSDWMMADYYGNLLIEQRTLEHQATHFKLAIEMIHEAQKKHGIEDLIVTVERTGRYHLSPQRVFKKAGFETRVIHPFATKQYRLPADPGNKTDGTDLAAQHRAAVAGFGLEERELDPLYNGLRLRIRHRRNLVENSTALACQIRDHLHVAMPGYDRLFANFFTHQAAQAVCLLCASPQAILALGKDRICKHLREAAIRFQTPTIEKIVTWAQQTAPQVSDSDAALHHCIWTDLLELYQNQRKRIHSAESEIAQLLVKTPYLRLIAIPGINVVSAADFAGEMGPITHYANANAITGRAGLYPSRYQSDQTDNADGAIVRSANRALRAAIMRIADNLARSNNHFLGQAQLEKSRGTDERAIRVKFSKTFSRLAFACVAGDEPLRHPCCQKLDSIIEKLREFFQQHQVPLDVTLTALEAAVEQMPVDTKKREAEIVSEVLNEQTKRRRGAKKLGELLPAVLARLGVGQTTEESVPD